MILETAHHFIGKCICIYACTYTYIMGFPRGSDGKESAYNAGELGLIDGLGRSPKGRHGNPLQYSCLENTMDRGAWWATVHGAAKCGTKLSTTVLPK